MMATWLKGIEIALRFGVAVATLAEAIDTSNLTTCFIGGSLSVTPIAWMIAKRVLPES
jgi:hypothetical protein